MYHARIVPLTGIRALWLNLGPQIAIGLTKV